MPKKVITNTSEQQHHVPKLFWGYEKHINRVVDLMTCVFLVFCYSLYAHKFWEPILKNSLSFASNISPPIWSHLLKNYVEWIINEFWNLSSTWLFIQILCEEICTINFQVIRIKSNQLTLVVSSKRKKRGGRKKERKWGGGKKERNKIK